MADHISMNGDVREKGAVPYLKELVKQLDCRESRITRKMLAYYDGDQEYELRLVLNETRREWKREGLVPRTRNVTKPIVEHSGQVIKDTPPSFAVYRESEDEDPDDQLSQDFQDIIDKSGELEHWINLDEVVRAVKTVVVLCQYNEEEDCLVFDLLHRGNAHVHYCPVTKRVKELLYLVEGDTRTSDYIYYRHFTQEKITDFYIRNETNELYITNEEDNNLGLIPIAVFYDVKAPRVGYWVDTPTDLIHANEMLNLHLTEAEFTMSWMKRPTLFTNMSLAEVVDEGLSAYNDIEEVEIIRTSTGKLPTRNTYSERIRMGPGAAVQLEGTGVDNPFAEYKAPDAKVGEMDKVYMDWIKGYASDWSVRIETSGQGKATSGFQLIVEELPNLELRKLRQKNLSAGFCRLFKIIAFLANRYMGYNFPEEAKLYVEFEDPYLPVEQDKQQEVWTMKLDKGRASLIDYFMEVEGMTRQQAEKKIVQIEEDNKYIEEVKAEYREEPEVEEVDEEMEGMSGSPMSEEDMTEEDMGPEED